MTEPDVLWPPYEMPPPSRWRLTSDALSMECRSLAGAREGSSGATNAEIEPPQTAMQRSMNLPALVDTAS